jgi:anti-sigma factor RsiW
MDHRTAALMGAREKYFLGELSEPEREEFEQHYFGCLECAERVRDAASFLDSAGPILAPAASASAPKDLSSRRSWWRGGHPATMAASLVFASLLGATAYQGLVIAPRLRRELRETETLRVVPSYPLTLSRSEPPIIAVSDEDRHVLLTLSQSFDRPYPAYRCRLQDATGRTLRAETLRPRPLGEELEILLPVTGLPAGAYVVTVEGVQAASASSGDGGAVPMARYGFTLEWR